MMKTKLTLVVGTVVFVAATHPGFAQTREATTKELLGRAQSQSGKRAVEDLIDKLRGARQGGAASPSAAGAAAATPAPGPQVATPPSQTPSSQTPAAAPAPMLAAPAVAAPPPGAAPQPAAGPAVPAAVATPAPPAAPASIPDAPRQAAAPPPASAPGSDAGARPATEATPATPATAVVAPRTPGPAVRAISQPSVPAVDETTQTPTLTRGADDPQTTPTAPGAAPVQSVSGSPPVVVRPTVKSIISRPFASDTEMAKAPETAEKLNLPRADVEVLFDLDSAAVTALAKVSLDQLGAALTDPRLAGQKFVVAGHTDGYGPDGYNVVLSQRRAEAVRQYMIDTFKLDPANLIARGFGKSQLKNKRNPFAKENRRVQIINWTSQTAGEGGN